MLLGTGQVKSKIGVDDDLFEYLRYSLDEVCSQIAEKYGLYDFRGQPRKAFVLDTLMKYSCCGCIMKVLTNQRENSRADMLFAENHKLAVNLLVEELRRNLNKAKLKSNVEGGSRWDLWSSRHTHTDHGNRDNHRSRQDA